MLHHLLISWKMTGVSFLLVQLRRGKMIRNPNLAIQEGNPKQNHIEMLGSTYLKDLMEARMIHWRMEVGWESYGQKKFGRMIVRGILICLGHQKGKFHLV
ncbi:Os07g0669800 [Oryza sativa Japonica Group]|nr:Os07g0669800 [Oryza sativa Japonica Group]|eukprot:NP_001060590.1 Os07g0669800 [Oryza sativa Japonica Group]